MGSIHNDLASWASKAASKGHHTIEITVGCAFKAADTIVELSTRIGELEETIRKMGGSPSVSGLSQEAEQDVLDELNWTSEYPDNPDRLPEELREYYIRGPYYDGWSPSQWLREVAGTIRDGRRELDLGNSTILCLERPRVSLHERTGDDGAADDYWTVTFTGGPLKRD